VRESREGVEEGWLVLFDGPWLSRKVRVVIFYSRTVDMSAISVIVLGRGNQVKSLIVSK